jgi:diguanylate cyclase (GGDEF)-like protein/PAS domain S-box-containing protein
MIDPSSFYTAYRVAIWLSALFSLGLTLLCWQRRDAIGGRPTLVRLLATTWWLLCYLVPLPQALITPSTTDIFLRVNLIMLGLVFAPPAILAFVLEYTGRIQRWRWWMLAAMAVEPAFVWYCVLDADFGQHFFAGWRGLPAEGHFKGGPYFWFHCAYSYALTGCAFWLTVQAYRSARDRRKAQLRTIMLAFIPPAAGNLSYLFGLTPVTGDVTPIGFLLSGAMLTYALFRQGFMDLVPVARRIVVEQMIDGVIVLDERGRIIDVNAASRAILGLPAKHLIGSCASDVLPLPGATLERLARQEEIDAVISLGDGACIDLRARLMASGGKAAQGLLLIFRDISEARRVSDALEAANRALTAQVAEVERMQGLLLEQASRDALTGLYNRRFMEESLERELARTDRTGEPLAVVLIDIDYFKKVNDNYGHLSGDDMLCALSAILQQRSRREDIACRYGGEEFLVILRNTSAQDAMARAAEWNALFAGTAFGFKGRTVHATFSAGIAVYPDDAQYRTALLEAADIALYDAKARGRNQVCHAAQGAGALAC